MSIFHRTAYLTLSALLAIVPAACGGDDDDDGDDTSTPDASTDGGDPDAAVEEPDAAPVEPDAAVIEGTEYLLSIELTATNLGTSVVRNRATVAVNGSTADLSLQPLVAPECDKATSGEAAGVPLVTTGIKIAKDFTFTINLENATIPEDVVDLTCGEVVVNLEVSGGLQQDGTICGTVTGDALNGAVALNGTFGSVILEKGTGAGDLPDPVVACVKK